MMLKPFLLSAGVVVAVLSTSSLASSHTNRGTHGSVDHYVMVPSRDGVDCEKAYAILERRGFHIYGTVRCGGNYHRFTVDRRGFNYIVHVMSQQGAIMVRNRSK